MRGLTDTFMYCPMRANESEASLLFVTYELVVDKHIKEGKSVGDSNIVHCRLIDPKLNFGTVQTWKLLGISQSSIMYGGFIFLVKLITIRLDKFKT